MKKRKPPSVYVRVTGHYFASVTPNGHVKITAKDRTSKPLSKTVSPTTVSNSVSEYGGNNETQIQTAAAPRTGHR